MSIEPSEPPANPHVLTQNEYWESGYVRRGNDRPLETLGFRNFSDRRIIETIEALRLADQRVLEIGAGDSAVLTHLAHKYRGRASFTGLDYSAAGCALLTRRAEREQALVTVVQRDLFEPQAAELGSFDVVYSYGVVEHFQNLPAVLLAKARFLAPGGRMLSIIPNMAGVLGTLTRRYNRRVYDLHVAHDLPSFVRGHVAAGLEVVRAGYVCSTNFGVLASCFGSTKDPGWRTYVWLTRLSKALWFMEDAWRELPHSARFSPYIYVTSRLTAPQGRPA